MPSPQVASSDPDDELDELQEAEEQAAAEAEQPERDAEAHVSEDLGEPASATPEINEELADPVPSGSDSFFSGDETVEDSISEEMAEDPTAGDPVGEPSGEPSTGDPLGDFDEEHDFAPAIIEGTARLGVVGIEDESTKNDLQDEFEDVFSAFQLGHYGNRVMHDYLLHGAEDVNPVFGLAGSAMMCAAMVVYLRPDGDEVISNSRAKLAELRNGDSA